MIPQLGNAHNREAPDRICRTRDVARALTC
jgi:hypothetical protein